MNNLLIDNKSKCKTDYKTKKPPKKPSKQNKWWLFQEVGLVKTLEFVNLEMELWGLFGKVRLLEQSELLWQLSL